MNSVQIACENDKYGQWNKNCREWAVRILDFNDIDNCELSLFLCSNNYIQKLNYQYRGLDRPTDVLSFSQTEGDDYIMSESGLCLLGDVVISIDKVAEQAETFDFSENYEFCRLLIHGILHLLGYDHEKTDEEAAEMQRIEEQLLSKLEVSRC